MPNIKHGISRQPRQSRQVTTAPKRQLSVNVQRALQFRRDILRGGSPSEILHLFEEEAEQMEFSSDDTQTITAEEDGIPSNLSDVSMADEDENQNDESPFEMLTHQAEQDSAIESSYWNRIVIPVIGDRAVFQIPDWALSIENDDLFLRWETYTSLADWLTTERRNFLLNPDLLTMAGVPARLTPPIPVLQEGLYQALQLQCDVSTFSKHARHGIIVWSYRECPVEDLWSQEAKLAWCAQAAIRRQTERGYASRGSDLGKLDIQPPRDSGERKRLRAEANRGWQLGPIRFVQLLCVITDCRWRDVVQRYGNVIFDKG